MRSAKWVWFGLSLIGALSGAANVRAAGLPEGAFKGYSSLIDRGLLDNGLVKNDVMALLLRKDPAREGSYFAVLAEYDRIPLTHATIFGKRSAITKWVPRLYAYRVDPIGDGWTYEMKPLTVTASWEIDTLPGVRADWIRLAEQGTIDGARMTRYRRDNQEAIEETIEFRGEVGSTWEGYIPGTYFGTYEDSGSDYFDKRVNMELSQDRVANFYTPETQGRFDVREKAPGLFVLVPREQDIRGVEKVAGKIGVFIDIVNWKPFMTTDELLLINPENPADVGFFYERH